MCKCWEIVGWPKLSPARWLRVKRLRLSIKKSYAVIRSYCIFAPLFLPYTRCENIYSSKKSKVQKKRTFLFCRFRHVYNVYLVFQKYISFNLSFSLLRRVTKKPGFLIKSKLSPGFMTLFRKNLCEHPVHFNQVFVSLCQYFV